VEGLLSDEKVLNVTGQLIISDLTNSLMATVTLDPNNCTSIITSVFGGFLSSEVNDPREKVRDFLNIKIENCDDGETVVKGKGSWLSQIKFEDDDEALW